MRQSLKNLLDNAIVYQYKLPYMQNGVMIPQAIVTTSNDHCFQQVGSNDDIANLIYNGIVEYSYNDSEVDLTRLTQLQLRALQSKLKYNPNAPQANQLAYGFHGEIMLHLLLERYFNGTKVIARGYMFSALENQETKGYDSYQMCEKDGTIYLLFGEAKFYISGYKDSIDAIFSNIDKAISDDYLNRNFIAFDNQYEHLATPSLIPAIIDRWRDSPSINMAVEAQNHHLHLVYPMLVIFDDKAKPYDNIIQEVITYINSKYSAIHPSLTIPHTLFFLFLPVNNSRSIKSKVLQWISQQQPLMP